MTVGQQPPQFTPPAPLPATAPQPKARARPISRKIKDAIRALHSGKARNWTQAAKVAGISREYLSRTLSERPDIVAWGEARARRLMALGVNIATPKMLELIHSKSERVAFEASRHVQAVAGIKPPSDGVSVNVGIELKAGYVIDLSEPGQSVKIIGGEAKPIESAGR